MATLYHLEHGLKNVWVQVEMFVQHVVRLMSGLVHVALVAS